LKLGESNSEFSIVRSQESDLLLEKRIVDAKYYGVASEEKLEKTYHARMWLDDAKKEVMYQEILEDQSRSVGVFPTPRLGFEKTFIKGKVLFKKEKGIAFGFKKPLNPDSFGRAYDYSFDVEKIRKPVRQIVEAAGWRFSQVILGK
jgi:hypothetical protein